MLICIIKCEIYTDSNTCNTRGSGCIKCTGTNPDECLVCIEGLKIKEFEGILINEDDLNNYEGKCIGINNNNYKFFLLIFLLIIY